MKQQIQQILQLAEQYIGYLEKSLKAYQSNNKVIYSKTDGAGSDNITLFNKELHEIYPQVIDFPASWCMCFILYLFVKLFGLKDAKRMLYGDIDDYTVNAAQRFKKSGNYYSKPQVGDIIFFKNTQRICHVGIVYAVDSKYVYTIEGNTSSAAGVIANGGAVAKKKYLLSYSRIAGYGRPDYDEMIVSRDNNSNPYEKPLNLLRKGSKGEGVMWLQYELNKHGYGLIIDGDFGQNTADALMDYQKNHPPLEIDAICGKQTRDSLLNT